MTVAAGVKTARTERRPGRAGRRSARPVVVARVTLSVAPTPIDGVSQVDDPVAEPLVLASRRDLHVGRRIRRHNAMLGLGVLAATLGATVAVLDMLH
jgi:hypothetical protein